MDYSAVISPVCIVRFNEANPALAVDASQPVVVTFDDYGNPSCIASSQGHRKLANDCAIFAFFGSDPDWYVTGGIQLCAG